MIEIPSKFLRQDVGVEHTVRGVYINIEHLIYLEVIKSIVDTKDKEGDKVLETNYTVNMILTNNHYVPLEYNFSEKLFQEFLLWCNKSLAFVNLKER